MYCLSEWRKNKSPASISVLVLSRTPSWVVKFHRRPVYLGLCSGVFCVSDSPVCSALGLSIEGRACFIGRLFFSLVSCQPLAWLKVQQMATGFCLGAAGMTRASLQAFGPGCCLETCEVAAGLVEGFQPGPHCPGREQLA